MAWLQPCDSSSWSGSHPAPGMLSPLASLARGEPNVSPCAPVGWPKGGVLGLGDSEAEAHPCLNPSSLPFLSVINVLHRMSVEEMILRPEVRNPG